MSSVVVSVFSDPPPGNSAPFSAHHPHLSSKHVRTIATYLLLPDFPKFLLIPACSSISSEIDFVKISTCFLTLVPFSFLQQSLVEVTPIDFNPSTHWRHLVVQLADKPFNIFSSFLECCNGSDDFYEIFSKSRGHGSLMTFW